MELLKIGGSLFRPDALPAVLDWLEWQARSHALLLVCGGGGFADAVRQQQTAQGYSDLTAHRQAMLAMEQSAWWLQEACWQRHRRHWPVNDSGRAGSLWTPRALLDAPCDALPASWLITSDSLAAWLAAQLTVDRLSLLKSLDCGELTVPAGTRVPSQWQAQAWVDPAFSALAQAYAGPVRLLGRRCWQAVVPLGPADGA